MIDDDNQTLWCGNISDQVTEEILYELFLQAGPLQGVRIARDKDGRQKSFGFITYSHEVSVPYALQLLRGTSLFNKKLILQPRSRTVPLPPPIRCYGPDPTVDFQGQPNIAQEFVQMTDRLGNNDSKMSHEARRPACDELTVASLQGNWSHRHHPYRSKEKGFSRDEHRPRDNSSNYNKHPSSWRDRRNHKKGSTYHRRN